MKKITTIKMSAYVPADLYLEFTRIARTKKLHSEHKTRGAMKDAIVESMKWYINENYRYID